MTIECVLDVVSQNCKPYVEMMESSILGNNDENKYKDISCSTLAAFAVSKLLPKTTRARHGIYFTPEKMAQRLADGFKLEIEGESSFFDPACGSGNLLIAVAQNYPLKKTLFETVKFWGGKFGGSDLNAAFITATKLRLIALACHRHGVLSVNQDELKSLVGLFAKFWCVDYLKSDLGGGFDCVIANPPFGYADASGVSWSSGRTQQAGIFLSEILARGKDGQRVAAILPDVLRSGARYSRWRSIVELKGIKTKIEVVGRFSAEADVDVFFLRTRISIDHYRLISESEKPWTGATHKRSFKGIPLKERFDVRIGPVVPHRIKQGDRNVPFLNAKMCPPFDVAKTFSNIEFSGPLIMPPFLVLRRTSSPSDRVRLVPTLVVGKKHIAVENHLIVLKPKDNKISSCRWLAEYLATPLVNDQINLVMRCRHITKKLVEEILLADGNYE